MTDDQTPTPNTPAGLTEQPLGLRNQPASTNRPTCDGFARDSDTYTTCSRCLRDYTEHTHTETMQWDYDLQKFRIVIVPNFGYKYPLGNP